MIYDSHMVFVKEGWSSSVVDESIFVPLGTPARSYIVKLTNPHQGAIHYLAGDPNTPPTPAYKQATVFVTTSNDFDEADIRKRRKIFGHIIIEQIFIDDLEGALNDLTEF